MPNILRTVNVEIRDEAHEGSWETSFVGDARIHVSNVESIHDVLKAFRGVLLAAGYEVDELCAVVYSDNGDDDLDLFYYHDGETLSGEELRTQGEIRELFEEDVGELYEDGEGI